MGIGLILSPQKLYSSLSRFPLSSPNTIQNCINPLSILHFNLKPTRFLSCKSSVSPRQEHRQTDIKIVEYKEAFSKQMAMAGLKPHHLIAVGVSGGPDSMALCALTAAWKTDGIASNNNTGGFVDGLLAIVVDHGLRSESNEEAHTVSSRLFNMGIRCEVVSCSWSLGKPKLGHIQEEARDMRYQKLQNVCFQHRIGVLLVAHHADDQAELFILRLSRNSGVLGLAGMAFASQIFSPTVQSYDEDSQSQGILLVRPLLQFSKEDMYKVCQAAALEWVEDPTNRSSLYARNRIRMSLGSVSSNTFKSELQALISACRKTRSFVDQSCCNLINQAVTTMHNQGYAIIDLEILNPTKVVDVCLAKFVSLVLQFISQRHSPVRGSASKLVLDYIRTFPCKKSLTAAGCYLCPAPGSKGSKVLVCCSFDGPLPSRMEVTSVLSESELLQYTSYDLKQIIADGKHYSDHFAPDAANVYFLDSTSESILNKAKRVNVISESTYRNILLLKRDEFMHFKAKTEDSINVEPKDEDKSSTASPSEQLRAGQMCYFMNRFLVSWKLRNCSSVNDVPESCHYHSWPCSIDHDDMYAEVRHMIESDWLYLGMLSKCARLDDLHQEGICRVCGTGQTVEERNLYLEYLRFSAAKALTVLKSIPVAARRSLPVLVNHQEQLLSIPSIGFKNCPCLIVSCEFKPRVPLGGGYSSFL